MNAHPEPKYEVKKAVKHDECAVKLQSFGQL